MQGCQEKDFSRVLNDPLQTWMKRPRTCPTITPQGARFQVPWHKPNRNWRSTCVRQETISLHTMPGSGRILQGHAAWYPTRKHLKPKRVAPLLPNVDNWGRAYNIVVTRPISRIPFTPTRHQQSIIANVESDKRMRIWIVNRGCQEYRMRRSSDKDAD
jgi:hypothetical protein